MSRQFRAKKPQRAKELSLAWRNKNIERVREGNRLAHKRFIEKLTPQELKAWQREKSRKAKENKIERVGGIEAFRAKENERLKNYYKNNPAAYEKAKQQNKLRMREKREKLKQEKQA